MNQDNISNGVNYTIENLLTSWGQTQRQLPPNNEVLKSQILAAMPPMVPQASKPQSFSMPWLSVAFGSLALAILFIQASGSAVLPALTYQAPRENLASPQTTGQAAYDRQSVSPAPAEPLAAVPAPKNQSQTTNPNPSTNSYQSTAPPGLSPMASSQAPAEQSPTYQNTPNTQTPGAIAQNSSTNTFSNEQTQNYNQPDYFPQPKQEVPIADNREFLKTNYSAGIQTRHIMELALQLQTIIRGFGGRVDAANSSANTGFISFAVPAGRFDAFKLEVKNLAGAKFYVESQSSQNLLPEKQSIEQGQNSSASAIAQLQANEAKLTADHNRRVAAIKAELDSVAQELIDLDYQLPPWSEVYQQRQRELLAHRQSLQRQLANENANYQNQLNSLDGQIQDNQAALQNLNQQDSNLLDTVATVRGTISLEGINFLQVINAYFSLYWIALILFAAAAISYFARRRNRLILS